MLRKLFLTAVTLIAVSFLASCGGDTGTNPPPPPPSPAPVVKFNFMIVGGGQPVQAEAPVQCVADFAVQNLNGHQVVDEWEVNGTPANCSEVLRSPQSGEPIILPPGTHTATVRRAVRNVVPVVADSGAVTFVVPVPPPPPPPPGRFLMTLAPFVDPDYRIVSTDFFITNDDGTSALRRLTFDGRIKFSAKVSLDGSKIAYDDVYNGVPGWCTSALFLADFSTNEIVNPVQITGLDGEGVPGAPSEACKARSVRAPQFSNTDHLAFMGAYGPGGLAGAFVLNEDGSDLELLFEFAISNIVFHPNGRDVLAGASVLIAENVLHQKVYRYDVLSKQSTVVFEDVAPHGPSAIRPMIMGVLPDGEWALFISPFWSDYDGRIGLLKLDGSGEIQWVDEVGARNKSTFLCYNGTEICYVPEDRFSIRATGFDGSNDREVSRAPVGSFILEPSWAVPAL